MFGFNKKNKSQRTQVEIQNIFEPPLWIIPWQGDFFIEEMVGWAYEIQKEKPLSNNVSNVGGYQSEPLLQNALPEVAYVYLRQKLSFLPEHTIKTAWVNINTKGNFNIAHTHPTSDLALVWYFTDNDNTLTLHNPADHTRFRLHQLGIGDAVGNCNCKAGDMVLFPADLVHRVNPHRGDNVRISFAANINFVGNNVLRDDSSPVNI